MRSKIYITAFAIGLIAILAAAVVVIFQAPAGWKFFGFGSFPGDRRVEWVQPPGRFEPKGGRVSSALPSEVPGGMVDFAGRTLHFRGLATEVPPTIENAASGVAFDRLRQSGINLITVPVRWQDLEPEPMQVSVDAILAIRAFLDAAGAAGIGVILVNTTPFSSMAACSWAPDAPAWAYRVAPPRSDAAGVGCTTPNKRDLEAAAMFRTDFVEARWTPDDITLQDHLIRSWVKLTEVVSRSPGLVGYGIADSMACPAGLASGACTDAWTGYVDRFANGIRAVNISALFFFGTDAPGDAPAAGSAGVIEIVPGAADDSARGPLKVLPPGSFTLDRKLAAYGSSFLRTVDAIERRGRSWIVQYPQPAPGSSVASTGSLPNAPEMARPRPDAVAGRNARFSFDRLSLPGADDRLGPGTTDVFTLEFDDDSGTSNGADETTVWLPASTLYRQPADQDAPAWTLDISDGSAEWLPGSRDVIIWRTIAGQGPHRMKIAPWGGRRLALPTDDGENR